MPASEVDVSVSQDGGIMKTISRQGEGQVTPEFGSEVISRSFLVTHFSRDRNNILGYSSLHGYIRRWNPV